MTADPLMLTQKVYRQLVNNSTGGPRHAITVPRNSTQVSNFRKEMSRDIWLTHNAMFNTYQLCFQLFWKNRNGTKVEFITKLSIDPNIVLHMIAQPLLELLENTLRLSSTTVILHYDTVFIVGDYYLSSLLFRHSMFKINPVIPFAYFVHSRRFHEDHICFIKGVRKVLTSSATKKIAIVTDQVFAFSEIFPVGYQLFC
jgi:hypothetical protein